MTFFDRAAYFGVAHTLEEQSFCMSNKRIWTPGTAKLAANSKFYHFWIIMLFFGRATCFAIVHMMGEKSLFISILTRSILKSRSKKSFLVNSTRFGFYDQVRTMIENSKIVKLLVLCAITFDIFAKHLKVIAAFKSRKIMFFEWFDKASILDIKNMNFCDLKATTTFRCVEIPPKIMAHNTWYFLFWEFLKKRSNSLR